MILPVILILTNSGPIENSDLVMYDDDTQVLYDDDSNVEYST